MSYINADRPSQSRLRRAVYLFNTALTNFSDTGIVSEKTLVRELLSSIVTFFSTLSKPLVSKNMHLTDGTNPDPDEYNDFTQSLAADMDAVYTQQNAAESVVVSNYNLLETQRGRLTDDLAHVKQFTDDFVVFSKSPDNLEIRSYISIECISCIY